MDFRIFPTPRGDRADEGPRQFGRREELRRERATRAFLRGRTARIVALLFGAAVLGVLVFETF